MNIAAETPKTNNLYPLQVWLISVVIISPILLFVGSVIFDPSYYKQLDNYIIILLYQIKISSTVFVAKEL
jgi:hypothetical protein